MLRPILMAAGVGLMSVPASLLAADDGAVQPDIPMGNAPADGAELSPSVATDVTPAAKTAAPIQKCDDGECSVKVSAQFVVGRAEQLILAGEYDLAKPWLDMLALAPDYALEYHFLSGLSALGQNDFATAESHYRAILDNDPTQTRVRLDLSYVLMRQGKTEAADYHLRLAEQSDDLPDELRTSVRTTRSAIRDKKQHRFGINIGLAPDTNINNATHSETVDINLGPFAIPLTLNDNARSRSGLGMTANVTAAYRMPVAGGVHMIVEADGYGVNYQGEVADDFHAQMAVGPEFQLNETTRLTVQAVGTQRWYGGEKQSRSFGARADMQFDLGRGSALAVRADAQRSNFFASDGYDGWSFGSTVSYERGIVKGLTLSTSVFARRNDFNGAANSSWSGGAVVGIGGELPYGFNIGASAVVSYAKFDEPDYLFSFDKRADMRYSARLSVGNRKLKVFGFSPSLEYSYSRNDSNYIIYDTDRHRAEFKLARYF